MHLWTHPQLSSAGCCRNHLISSTRRRARPHGSYLGTAVSSSPKCPADHPQVGSPTGQVLRTHAICTQKTKLQFLQRFLRSRPELIGPKAVPERWEVSSCGPDVDISDKLQLCFHLCLVYPTYHPLAAIAATGSFLRPHMSASK